MFTQLSKKGLSVRQTADRLNKHAYVLSHCTLLMGSWVANIAEVEVKVMLGNHLHKDASAVHCLRNRIVALGCEVEKTPEGHRTWHPLLSALTDATNTLVRLYGMYNVLKRKLIYELRQHMDQTHEIWDEPTVRILKQIVVDLEEEITWATCLSDQMRNLFCPGLPLAGTVAEWQHILDTGAVYSEFRVPAPPVPARDCRFRFTADLPPLNVKDPDAIPAALHRMLTSIEITTIEVCGALIADSSELPWEFVLDMARQCWDESRHAILCYDRIIQLGGRIGQFAINTDLWEVSYDLPIALRLAAHQRIGEWLGVDGAIAGIASLRIAGDEITARSLEYVVADEIAHVSYGNKWLRYLTGGDDEKVLQFHFLAMQKRERFGGSINGSPDLPLNREACLRSGFTLAEVDVLAKIRTERANRAVTV